MKVPGVKCCFVKRIGVRLAALACTAWANQTATLHPCRVVIALVTEQSLRILGRLRGSDGNHGVQIHAIQQTQHSEVMEQDVGDVCHRGWIGTLLLATRHLCQGFRTRSAER